MERKGEFCQVPTYPTKQEGDDCPSSPSKPSRLCLPSLHRWVTGDIPVGDLPSKESKDLGQTRCNKVVGLLRVSWTSVKSQSYPTFCDQGEPRACERSAQWPPHPTNPNNRLPETRRMPRVSYRHRPLISNQSFT
jgi:hypothetical protein